MYVRFSCLRIVCGFVVVVVVVSFAISSKY